jgi:5-methyltetrahydropteroyltriglutamate--homocysteine methyltransferase
MKRSENRILTTHVGSLIRPAGLFEALSGVRDRSPAHDGLVIEILDGAIKDIVRRQAEVGIDIINDGEFGESSWANCIFERISGFENRPNQKAPVHRLGSDPQRFDQFFVKEMPLIAEGLPVDACTGPIAYTDPIPMDTNIRLLKQALDSVSVTEAFLTAVATGKPLPLQV